MIYTLNPQLAEKLQVRLLGIFSFVVLTAIAAKIAVFQQPVPFTLQVMLVLMAGIVLGARDGFISQLTYISLIGAGLPLDVNSLGAAAFAGPTAGYLLAFPIAAGVVGALAVHQNFVVRFGASLVGVAIIYLIGGFFLKTYLGVEWSRAWELGVAPFIVWDLLKAVIASSVGESGRRWWLRMFPYGNG